MSAYSAAAIRRMLVGTCGAERHACSDDQWGARGASKVLARATAVCTTSRSGERRGLMAAKAPDQLHLACAVA